MKHLGTKTLESDRLLLRRARVDDADDMYHSWASDKEVTKYLSWKPHADVEESETYIREVLLSQYENNHFYEWFVVYKPTGEVIGSIGNTHYDPSAYLSEFGSIGYCYAKRYWHQGIASEALKVVLDYLLQEVGYHRIEGVHHIDNIASGKVMEKAGMIKEGVLKQKGLSNDKEYCDLVMYGIVKK